MAKDKKTLYMVQVNLGGISGPFALQYNEDYEPVGDEEELNLPVMNCWWDETGNFSVSGPGYFEKGCLIRYASYDPKDVDIFLQGAVSLKKVMCKSVLSGPHAIIPELEE